MENNYNQKRGGSAILRNRCDKPPQLIIRLGFNSERTFFWPSSIGHLMPMQQEQSWKVWHDHWGEGHIAQAERAGTEDAG